MSTSNMSTATMEERWSLLNANFGTGIVVLSIIFFQSMNLVVSLFNQPKRCVSDTPFWRWRNLLISWLHAIIIGSWVVSCFFIYPELFDNLISGINLYTYLLVAVSTGYFIYDLIDIMRTRTLVDSWQVVAHHITVIIMFFWNVITCQCIFYNVVALLSEINSIFLHTRKLMQMFGVAYNSIAYRINAYMNLLSFVFGRFGAIVAITYGVIYLRHQVSLGYCMLLSSATIAMMIINCVLFRVLLKNDFLRPYEPTEKSKKQREKSSKDVSSNNNVLMSSQNGIVHNFIANGTALVSNGHAKQM